jgi:hypothetical protein
MVKKDTQSAAAPTANVSAPPSPVKKTQGEEIWNEIKDKQINMFALPGQTVSSYAQPVPIEPTRCFLLLRASSAVPAIEEALGDKYGFEIMDKYMIISRKNNAF